MNIASKLNTPRPRLLWLDAVKGIGICAVVAGHVIAPEAARYLYLWHMPLFFFLAGYVFRPEPDLRQGLRDKAVRLLLPYLLFLALLSGPDLLAAAQAGTLKAWTSFALTHAMGGKSVHGWLVAVWFVTCLFLSLQVVNLGVLRLAPRHMAVAMAASLALACVNALLLPHWWLPWAANVCLFAAPVCYAGHLYRRHVTALSARWVMLAIAVSAAGLGLVGAGWMTVPDMKNSRYGTPVLSLVIALAIAVALLESARRWLVAGPLARGLARLGSASMVIMFLHMAVQRLLLQPVGVDSELARIVLATALPTAIHALLQRQVWTRALFLGSVPDFDTLNARYRPTALHAADQRP